MISDLKSSFYQSNSFNEPIYMNHINFVCLFLHITYYSWMVQIYGIGKRVWMEKEDLEEAKDEFIQCLKTLEGELGDKVYFGGDNIGFVDVALLPFTSWF